MVTVYLVLILTEMQRFITVKLLLKMVSNMENLLAIYLCGTGREDYVLTALLYLEHLVLHKP